MMRQVYFATAYLAQQDCEWIMNYELVYFFFFFSIDLLTVQDFFKRTKLSGLTLSVVG